MDEIFSQYGVFYLMTGVYRQHFIGISHPFCSITNTFSGLDSTVPKGKREFVGTIYCGRCLDGAPATGSDHNMRIAVIKIQPTLECVWLMNAQWTCPSCLEKTDLQPPTSFRSICHLLVAPKIKQGKRNPLACIASFRTLTQQSACSQATTHCARNENTMAGDLTCSLLHQPKKEVGQVLWADSD